MNAAVVPPVAAFTADTTTGTAPLTVNFTNASTGDNLIYGWDFGDGVNRHPVQLYESFAMLIFLVMFIQRLRHASSLFCRHGFYLFIVFYSIQRFLWEFIKPYRTLIGRLNIFHIVCLALLTYALFMIKVSEKSHA